MKISPCLAKNSFGPGGERENMTHKSLYMVAFAACLCVAHGVSYSAPVASRASNRGQSVIQAGTTVRTKVAATDMYSTECHDAYYGCMDQFCIMDNGNGGSCACSDENEKFEKQLAEINKKLEQAEHLSKVEVERIKAGANEDIIFGGTREYDAAGNIISSKNKQTVDTTKRSRDRTDLMALLSKSMYDEDEEDVDSIANKTGVALYRSADNFCRTNIPAACQKDMTFLTQLYSTQIKSDCKAFENNVSNLHTDAETALASANADVRGALMDSFKEANKFDRGTCMLEFRKCMQEDDVCGADWSKCVSTIASENMQNKKATSTANTKIAHTAIYDITDSTLEMLSAKRNICEKILNQCVVVRDMVWPDFLREAAPTIRAAELAAESKMRQSCLTDISACITTACKDDISGKGVATMDACLSRPEMARSFCKVEIDTCERMEPLIWGYVVDKLAAMRVDACNDEVKTFLVRECGEDMGKCAGVDYAYVQDLLSKHLAAGSFVVCRKNNPDFGIDDLNNLVMGLYLNMDNSALELCQQKVDAKMMEICGSTSDCSKFTSDDTIGTSSLRSQKIGTIYRVTGMISFGSIKMGDASGSISDSGKSGVTKLGPGELGVNEYMEHVRSQNSSVVNADGIMSSIEHELNNIVGKVNSAIDLIESDMDIQFCVKGRDSFQVTGNAASQTKGRFPHLIDQVKMQIASAALRQANDNYNKKLNAEIAIATKDASADLAQFMCQRLAASGGELMTPVSGVDTPLTPPYAISYDVGAGLTAADLTRGGHASIETNKISGDMKKFKFESGGTTRELWSVFNRETRNCHFCTSTVTQNCSAKKTSGFWGIGAKKTMNCTSSEPVEKCEDIPM